jgi:PHD/YefM family antitoxin component YafN of YafNO toxin-antitoxin module
MKVELITNLKCQATESLADLRLSKESVRITEHGKPSAYLVDVQDYEFMQRRFDLLEGLSRGERVVLEGRTYSQSEAREKMSK